VTAASGASLSERAAQKVRVLRREGDYLEVRDEEGNEGWVSAKAVK
jgi:hypothetical protein